MKAALLAWLSSPCCGKDLKSVSPPEPPPAPAELVQGRLACASCGREYPIRGGVPRLAEGGEGDPRVARTRESFAWEWLRYPGPLPEDEGVFLAETQLPAEAFKDRLVLDAGCGMGRYSRVALSLGATVVALDLSESLIRLAEAAPSTPRLHVVQGDLLKPPLKPGIFDIVYSQGVLHHTPDTREAFRRVAELVKPGGCLSVWVYGKAGRFADFKTNPLRDDRSWVGGHRRLAWLVVGARHAVSDALRVMTTRLPIRATYALSHLLAAAGAVPVLKYLTFSVHPDFKVRAIENFDWLSPPFQFHHTKEELLSWFTEAGFEVLKVLPHGLIPKPGVLGRKR